ncbi:zinc finger MYM-type protein 1 [Sphaeramia orbicularis]|uniref:zinc finger MYM-type protein 1 n=1 Tax=Sphaeramia orbicularis TaxID=375764 RepID=UPI00117F2FDA|nr:zinc finger MYM-type protein 1-like [Sphaeramia orbicularis]XP_030002748.1 zinc finger MYM-type protein 1-like [Sphaeramia orbicularis]XP_030002749.1 zinc finger MYM-type protein 1-like [Sphaeramia orbicularis]XP_030002750.1 zinc finger MYM-type protein 1-like [Sphaeramia orbicularis]XP_030002751.1 zinc finger MYM-type protein 1-like [Sphaeramia orbicularis]XP_030002752.1 zinc finger MYM-type protein 1-like [Sphaeramia orbicularis]XP_030002753.1 zinc finger MYM-type protein 1-like [Sphaera
MTGCKKTNRLFCWSCLLFTSDKSSTWVSSGFISLTNLSKSAHRHQNSATHLQATVCLKTFGDSSVDLHLDEQRCNYAAAHNNKVRQNREILKRLINVVTFLGKQELAFRGHDVSKDSENKGNYLELLEFLAEYDSPLRCHLDMATVFIGTSSKIQNNLIQAVADVMTEAMKAEVRETPFVSVMVDETTDVNNTAQMSYVLRYTTDGDVKERFFQFSDVSGDKCAEAIAGQVLEFLEDCGCTDKVIAQCYDGATVMASGLNGVQAKIKEKIPQALFVHCCSHSLNLVMSQGASKIKECKIFFSHLNDLAAFFSKSAKRMKLLDEICQQRLPRVTTTQWNFSSCLVCAVYERREELLELFEFILDNPSDFDDDTVHSADGYMTLLSGFEFCFLLAMFNSLFAYSNVLFRILQNNEYDMQFCLSSIDDFCSATEKEKASFDSIYEDTVRKVGDPCRHRAWRVGDVRVAYQQLHSEILNNILTQLRNRFKDHEKLLFLALLDPKKFASYRKNFPNSEFESLAANYGLHFDLPRLKTELTVMYNMSIFEAKSPLDLHRFLTVKELTESMQQLFRLTSLILTIPVSTSFVERSFSALKRIKTHTRSSTGQDCLGALALMSIERGLLLELKSKDKLHDTAIAHFMKKDQRMDFVFM